MSIEKENFKIFKYLIESGAKPNLKDQFGNTALHQASILEKNLFFILLTSFNGNINVQNVNGWTCMHMAAFYNRHKIIKKMLPNKKAPIDIPDKENYLPLHIAAARGSFETVDLLVKRGSDVNALSSRGETPVLLASLNKHPTIVRLLIDYKADISIKDLKGDFHFFFFFF